MAAILKISASELQLARHCPRLLAYSRRDRDSLAWSFGGGNDEENCGWIFHEAISGKFFAEAAASADFSKIFHEQAKDLPARLRDFIEENYFTPMLAARYAELTAKQAVALANAAECFARILSDLLLDIPSLLIAPEAQIPKIFHPPEQLLAADYEFPDRQILRVTGKYDGLLFNPDSNEFTLCEFHGDYHPQPAAKALSPVVARAWLVYAATGIAPAAQLWHWKNPQPVKFTAAETLAALDAIPELFAAARQTLKNQPPLPRAAETLTCRDCRYRANCDQDWGR